MNWIRLDIGFAGPEPRRSSGDEAQVFGKQLGGADAVSNLSRM
jgi:hypothetical protein